MRGEGNGALARAEVETSADAVCARLPGFYKLSVPERLDLLARMFRWGPDDLGAVRAIGSLSAESANQMIENALGIFSLPLGVGLNLSVNGRDYLVPMVIEEPSVVAAVSFAAKIVRESGGFAAEAEPGLMIGQVQVTRYGDPVRAAKAIAAHEEQILALANSFHPAMQRREEARARSRCARSPLPRDRPANPSWWFI